MAKPEWGKKRLCPSCGTKFYDLRKSPPACPSCGETVDVEAPTKTKRSRGKDTSRSKPAAAAAPAPAAEAEADPVLGEETDEAPLDDDTSYDEASEEIDDGADLAEDDTLGNVGGEDQEDN